MRQSPFRVEELAFDLKRKARLLISALLREGSPGSLAAAVERHGGLLLDGFDAKSPSFEQWIEERRRELRRELLQAMVMHEPDGAARAVATPWLNSVNRLARTC